MQKTPASSHLNIPQFETRKRSHLEIALRPEVQAGEGAMFDAIPLAHDALPELDFSEVSLATPFLKGVGSRNLATPFFVSGMTAGHASAAIVNERLAAACAKRGWIFGVGSQRRELDRSRPAIDGWRGLKAASPGLVVLGNLGLAEVVRTPVADVKRLAKNAAADAFCVHLNALQEVIQPEGNPDFRGGLAALRKLATGLGAPLVLKETGCGLSARTLAKIRTLKLAAVDVSGLGGTHWGRIEGVRAELGGDAVRGRAAATFADWGVSTVESVRLAAKMLPRSVEIWASGGVRTGLDAAKLISIGATRVGFAKPALEAALASEAELARWMETVEFELKIALFCTGNPSPKALRAARTPVRGGAR